MSEKKTSFQPRHMDELRRLGMGGYPCATFAAMEIEQLNNYVLALEYAMVFAHSNGREVRMLLAAMRQTFAPDVEFGELPEEVD